MVEWGQCEEGGFSTLGDFIEWRSRFRRRDTNGHRSMRTSFPRRLSSVHVDIRLESTVRFLDFDNNLASKNNDLTNFVLSLINHHHHLHHITSPTTLNSTLTFDKSLHRPPTSSLSHRHSPRRVNDSTTAFATKDKKIRVEIIVDPSRVPPPSLGSRLGAAPSNAPTAYAHLSLSRQE